MSCSLLSAYPLSDDHVLVAQGSYEYSCNDKVMDIQEPWLIHRVGSVVEVRSERVVADSGLTIQVFGTLNQSTERYGLCDQFQVRWLEGDSCKLQVDYRLEQEQLKVARSENSNPASHRQAVLCLGSVNFPLMRIFLGPMIEHILSQHGEAQVVIPCIKDPQDTEELLWPLLSQRSANVLYREDISVGHRDWFNAACCEYVGDQYEVGARFWFSERGILLHYQWQQSAEKKWDVRLINFSGDQQVLDIQLSD